jgi:hypothetical protein
MDKEKRSIGQLSTTNTQTTKEGLFAVDICVIRLSFVPLSTIL